MANWFLPKLESALKTEFTLSDDKSVLNLTTDIILHLANQSACSCAKVLAVSETPSTLRPLLPFITKTISNDDSPESAELLIAYYQKFNLEK